jgi:uncharacterized protein YecE (DUF72 family)
VPSAASLRIGLAGWSEAVSRHRKSFSAGPGLDPAAPALTRYASVFDFVEINASFYRQFSRETFAKWAAEVPSDFRFAVKMHRLITHYTRLKDTALLGDFAAAVAGLGEKLSAVLIQLPPTLAYDHAVAAPFFAALRERYAGAAVCEPRHGSWREPAALALLAAHRVGVVRTEIPDAASSAGGVAVPIYVRLHGTPRRYYSAYTAGQLSDLADWLALYPARDRLVVFDNTASSAGVRNALELRRLADRGA